MAIDMNGQTGDSVRRLRRIKRYLTIAAVALAVTVVFLAILDFG